MIFRSKKAKKNLTENQTTEKSFYPSTEVTFALYRLKLSYLRTKIRLKKRHIWKLQLNFFGWIRSR